MILEVKVPSPGESITEVEIANWLVSDGDYVQKDQEICEIDSDKATLTISAEESGKITLKVIDETVPVGAIVCTIDTSVSGPKETNSLVTNNEKNVVNIPLSSIASPSAKKIMRENNLDNITGTGKGGRVTKQDVINSKPAMGNGKGDRVQSRKKLSSLRRRLANRLVSVKNDFFNLSEL